MNWQRMATYPSGATAVFWVADGDAQYVVFGVLEDRGQEGQRRVWDDNDFGYAVETKILAWAPCSPPRWLMH